MTKNRDTKNRIIRLLGPAFVAAIAYVDPGNFAANFSAGAEFGYQLLWVLVLANLMAMLIQYLSAKVGIVTGKSLPQLIAQRTSRRARISYWLQAELVAIATDLAEVVGGAIALNFMFGIPPLIGALITGAVSMVLLQLYRRKDPRVFERVIAGMLLIIPIGFVVGLIIEPPEAGAMMSGLIPQIHNQEMVLLATAMLGATVMPHVIYLHSALSRDRHEGNKNKRLLLKATKVDVLVAMLVAGSVNILMLLLAASGLRGAEGLDDLSEIFRLLGEVTTPLVSWLFGIGLLVAGFASTAVGAQAGAIIMGGMIKRQIPIVVRRLITILPAIVLIGFGVNATSILIWSQVILSMGIPFALIPLVLITRDQKVMGKFSNPTWLSAILTLIVVLISVLNLALIVMSF